MAGLLELLGLGPLPVRDVELQEITFPADARRELEKAAVCAEHSTAIPILQAALQSLAAPAGRAQHPDVPALRAEIEQELKQRQKELFEAAWAPVGPKVHEAQSAGKFRNDTMRKLVKAFDAAHAAVVDPMNAARYDAAVKALPALDSAASALTAEIRRQAAARAKVEKDEPVAGKGLAGLRRANPPAARALLAQCDALMLKFSAQTAVNDYAAAVQWLGQVDKLLMKGYADTAEWQKARTAFLARFDPLRGRLGSALSIADTPQTTPLKDQAKAAQQAVLQLINLPAPDFAAATLKLAPLEKAIGALETRPEHAERAQFIQAERDRNLPARHDDVVAGCPRGLNPALDALLDKANEVCERVRAAEAAKTYGAAAKLVDTEWHAAVAKLEKDSPAMLADKIAYDEQLEKSAPLRNESLLVRTKPDPFPALWDALDKHYLAMDAASKALQFKAATEHHAKLVAACEALLKAATELDAVASVNAKAAAGEAKQAAASGVLAAKPLDYKLALLKRLRATSKMNADSTPEQWDAQKQIFRAMTMDPAFLKEDADARKKIVAKLTGDPEVLRKMKQARDGWSKASKEQKKAALETALKAQCEALGFGDQVPEIVLADDAPAADGTAGNGEMLPNGKIKINMHESSTVHDFQLALDLVFHENSHNYQNKLVKMLEADQLKPGSPLYNQALMFQANQAGGHGSYVGGSSAKEFDDYQRQPIEDHAHSNGGKTTRAVAKALN